MDDDMDLYLSRCLKNWAAQQQPPANQRARLLLLATAPAPEYFDESDLDPLVVPKRFTAPREFFHPYVDRSVTPFSLVWAFHIPMAALRMI